MFLICSSCNSKYLVNSADLKPNGRTVRCATCNYEWFQEPQEVEQVAIESSTSSSLNKENSKLQQDKNYASNLPSTYLEKDNVSIFNSILVIILFIIFVVAIWVIQREGTGIIAIINFYIQEFYFNLKLIVNDLAKIINQIINL